MVSFAYVYVRSYRKSMSANVSLPTVSGLTSICEYELSENHDLFLHAGVFPYYCGDLYTTLFVLSRFCVRNLKKLKQLIIITIY